MDRPNPTKTIIIDTVHDYYIDNNCPDSDNKPSIFHSVKIQLKDPATNKLIKEFPGEGNGLRDYYACYQTAQDPKNPIILSGKDTVNIYSIATQPVPYLDYRVSETYEIQISRRNQGEKHLGKERNEVDHALQPTYNQDRGQVGLV